MKINNSVIFDSETFTRIFPGNDCPMNYQKFYEKHLPSANLIKSVLFKDGFCIYITIWKFLRTAIKNAYVRVINETQCLNKNFCNIDLNNFLIIS